MAARIQIHRTSTANSPPTANYLLPGELAIEMNAPVRLWSGVPTALDATGRKLIFQLPLAVAQGGTGATTAPVAFDNLLGVSGAVTGSPTRNAAGVWSLASYAPVTNPANGTQNYAPLANPTLTGLTTVNAVLTPNTMNGNLLFAEPSGAVRRLQWANIWTTDTNGFGVWEASNVAGGHPYIYVRRSRGTYAANQPVQAGDILGRMAFQGNPSSSHPLLSPDPSGAHIIAAATQNWTAALQGTRLYIEVTPMGGNLQTRLWELESPLNPTEGDSGTMRLYSPLGGWWQWSAWPNAVGFGPPGGGEWVWWNQVGINVTLWVPGTITAGGTITPGSDARDKESIAPLEYGLAEIRKLLPRRWFWRVGERTPQAGVVAQELEPIIPEAVVTKAHPKDATRSDKKFINPMALIGVLIKAVQQLADRLETLEAR